jgi:hypothetical protein
MKIYGMKVIAERRYARQEITVTFMISSIAENKNWVGFEGLLQNPKNRNFH